MYLLCAMCSFAPVGPVSGHLSFMWRNALPNCVQIAHADNSFSLRHIKAFAIVQDALVLLLLLLFWSCQIVTPTRAALCSSCQQTETSTSTSTLTATSSSTSRKTGQAAKAGPNAKAYWTQDSNRHSFVQFNAGQGHFALQYPPGHPIPAQISPTHRWWFHST